MSNLISQYEEFEIRKKELEDLYEQRENIELKLFEFLAKHQQDRKNILGMMYEEIATILKLDIMDYKCNLYDAFIKIFDTEEKALEHLKQNEYIICFSEKDGYSLFQAEYSVDHYNHIIDYSCLHEQSVFQLLKELKNKEND